MAVVAFSTPCLALQEELRPFERVALSLSTALNGLQPDDTLQVVNRALEEVGTAFGLDECTLIAFLEPDSVKVVGSWALPPHEPCGDEDVAKMPSLVQRLSRNSVVATTAAAEGTNALAEEAPSRDGITARLAVPVSLGGRVAYGLIVGSRQRYSDWRTAFVDRLKLAAEILGSGLERQRQEEALHANQVDIEPFASGERADSVYLHEEAR
jgi:GAF domain-containing protein